MNKHLEELIAAVDLYIDLESSLEKYYEYCAKIFPDEKFAWFGIATQEGIHAKIFKKIKERMIEFPEKWELGKYNRKAVKTMVDEVYKKLGEIESGNFVAKAIVSFARDVESSLIESDIAKSFISEVSDYPTMIRKITEETDEHKDFINRFLNSL